ncbi:MAG: hypothetical protein AABY22_28880 [Nanoarchaeota archaeon]
MELYNAFKPRRHRSLSISTFGLTAEDFHLNGLYVEPADLRSGIRKELGQIFSSLNRLKLNKDFINETYETIRQEVM